MSLCPTVPILVWGASGHAKVLRPIMKQARRTVVALVERDASIPSPFEGGARFLNERDVAPWIERNAADLEYALAIGGSRGMERVRLATWLERLGLRPFTAVHATAFVADTATIGHGCHVLALAGVCEDVVLGQHSIINTKASVDHECCLGSGVHIMPGATIAGCVTLGDFATVGSNATILPRLRIGEGATIGAGAVVTRDVHPFAVVTGVPARPHSRGADTVLGS